jgi:hypothetical protein
MSAIRQHAVYNPRITLVGMLILLLRLLRAAGFLFVAVFLLRGPMAMAADWAAPEAQLAGKIVAATGPGAVALDIANHSSISRADVAEISRGLRSQLAASGVQFVNPDQAAATVQVSLSEDLQSFVWVAEIHQGANQPSVVMISTPRAGALPAAREASAVVIHKALLWAQAERILDVAVVDTYPPHMIVLDGNQVILYKQQGNRWQPEQSMPVTHARARPRDLRGRLVLRKDHLFDAYLPGVFCRSSATAPLALNCFESDDPWPLATGQFNLSAFYTSARNYFTGALAPGIGIQTNVPAFYSAAALPREKYTLWIFAAADGQVHLLDGITDQRAGRLDWGSDIASVNTGCGLGWDVLAASSADRPSDSVRAFEVADREPLGVSQPVEFHGRITALWTESNGTSVIAISSNLETGDYEAFRLSFACGQ